MVSRKKSAKDYAFVAGLYVLAAVISFFALAVKYIGVFICAAAFYGAYYFSQNAFKEFEYILTGTDIDVDLIIAKSRRKRLLSLEGNEITLIAGVNDERHSHRQKEHYDKVIDAQSHYNNSEVYFVTFEKDGKGILYFEPSDKMLEMLKKQMPNKVFIKTK